jgi:hypothetical protein
LAPTGKGVEGIDLLLVHDHHPLMLMMAMTATMVTPIGSQPLEQLVMRVVMVVCHHQEERCHQTCQN